MRYPRISPEWMLYETGDMFEHDDETVLSPETLDEIWADDEDEE